jgi:hypothetical protein
MERSWFVWDLACAALCGEARLLSGSFSSDKRLLRRTGFSTASRSGVVGNLFLGFLVVAFGSDSSAGGAGGGFSGEVLSAAEFRTPFAFAVGFDRLFLLKVNPSTSSSYTTIA